MFNENSQAMLREGLIKNMQKVVDAFDEPLNYYSISKSLGYRKNIIKPRKLRRTLKTEEEIIK